MQEVLLWKSSQARFNKLTIVSNRTPYVFRKTRSGTSGDRAVSGLVSALEPIIMETGGQWIGWGGRTSTNRSGIEAINVPFDKPAYTIREICLSRNEYSNYYLGFSNQVLWPLCHCFLDKCHFKLQFWQAYKAVNRRLADAACDSAGINDLIWVHDFHLAVVPELIRITGRNVKIAFFWHIPFPPREIFATLPWAGELLKGMLGSDLIAFHLDSYVENFLSCVQSILGSAVNFQTGTVNWGGRIILVKALPIGIDFKRFEKMATSPQIRRMAENIREKLAVDFLFVSAERLDYTKGILEKLVAIETFLENNPIYIGRVAFLQVAAPSRTGASAYIKLKRLVDEAVGRINGRFTNKWRVPVHYLSRPLDTEELVAHYLAADAALVTPLRDGLNLMAKEFVACRTDGSGILVLSPFAGAAEQLREALEANPYDTRDMAAKIREAIKMPAPEVKKRMKIMRTNVEKYDLRWWWKNILRSLYFKKSDIFKVPAEKPEYSERLS
jgi:trehalose 6-phosphate synthase